MASLPINRLFGTHVQDNYSVSIFGEKYRRNSVVVFLRDIVLTALISETLKHYTLLHPGSFLFSFMLQTDAVVTCDI